MKTATTRWDRVRKERQLAYVIELAHSGFADEHLAIRTGYTNENGVLEEKVLGGSGRRYSMKHPRWMKDRRLPRFFPPREGPLVLTSLVSSKYGGRYGLLGHHSWISRRQPHPQPQPLPSSSFRSLHHTPSDPRSARYSLLLACVEHRSRLTVTSQELTWIEVGI